MRQPSKKSSRVPRYQKGRRIDGFCNSSVKTPHIGGGLVGGGCLLVRSLRQRSALPLSTEGTKEPKGRKKVGWLGEKVLRTA